MEYGLDKKYYVPGYGGYIPGDKWKFGSRSSSEPPPLWRNYNGVTAAEENYVAARQQQEQMMRERPQSRRQRFQSAKGLGGRVRSNNYLERIATRPMEMSTQFPVQTMEMATQADTDGVVMPGLPYDVGARQIPMQREALVVDPARRARPPSRRGGRPPLDGRVINNQRADVLFMPNDPFKDLGSQNYGSKNNDRRREGGRYYYDAQGQQRFVQNGQEYVVGPNGQLIGPLGPGGIILNDGFPTAGYSGHIPGLRAFVGKPYGDALRSLRDGQQKQALQPFP